MPFPKDLIKIWGKELDWKCEICGRDWRKGWILEGHHKFPTYAGGEDVRSNFQLLCLFCHYKAHVSLRLSKVDHPNSANLVLVRLKKTGGRWKP